MVGRGKLSTVIKPGGEFFCHDKCLFSVLPFRSAGLVTMVGYNLFM